MDIKEKAKLFAIDAHSGQFRKADKAKPMIIHPIDIANILKEYGFDDSVVAAGYLHDVVEDTKYTIEDIEENFGENISSLVIGASEPDKSLSWEERKKLTIKKIRNLDLRHKAIICADKISNLEDLRILFGIKGKSDFSCFNRGFEQQKWYYTEVYNSLIQNEDEDLPMFERLSKLIDYVFYNKTNEDYLKEEIFKDKIDEYNILKKIHYRKEELYKLKQLIETVPYVIEFTGTPRTGKTTLINNLYDFFKKKGFKVEVLEEFTTSEKYKNEIYPILKNESKYDINIKIPEYVLEQLDQSIATKPDIIIVDRSLFDRLIWIDRLYNKNEITNEQYESYKEKYLPLIKSKINIIIATYTDSLTALKRDYQAHLSLEERKFLNEKNLDEYNNSLLNMESLADYDNINFYIFDTTKKTQRQVSFDIVDHILDDMKEKYIERVNDKKELIKKA